MLYCLSFIVLILLAAPAAALDSVSLVAEQPVANEQGLVPARVLFTRTGSGYPLTVRYRISGVARSTLHGGSVAAVQVDSYGNNYITPLITGQLIGGAAPASAAVITAYGGSGRIGSITVTEGGSDYYRVISEQGGVETREPLAPLVKIIGDGFGARATAQVSGSEQGYRVTHVIVESGGRGYSYATIVFEPQSGNGSGAVAVANIVGSPTIDVQVQSRGYGYPLPTISAVGDGTGAVLRPVIRDGRLYRVAIEQPGSGYTAPPVIVISGGSGHGASAVATINEAGQIAEVTVTNGGSGYGPTLHFDDPNTTAEFPVSARLLLADADYLAPPNTSIDPQTGDLIGTLTFSAAERTKVLTIAPRRNGVSGAVTAHVTLEPSETGSYIISYPMSVRISIADADDTARVAVTRPVAYPTPPTITPGVYPLEVQGRGELRVQVQQASHNRLRSIAVELSHDPGQGPLPGNEECWFAYSSKALDETATDYALVVPKKPAQPDPPPGPGSEEIAVDRLIFDINDIVIFHEPSAINNGIYRVVAVSGGKQNENPTIKISPELRVIQTAYGVTRVRRIARFIASADLGSLRETTYTSYSDLYFYVFPVIDAHPPRARRSLMLQLLQTEDYRIVTPTTGSVILADDAVTARIRHVSNAVRPTVSGAVEVEFSRPFSKPVQVPFRILEAGTTAQIGRMNTQNPEDDVFILGLDPESKFGRLEIPAGATVGQIIVQPNPLNREAVLEQVTIQLMPSYDYLFGPLGTSPVNPTAVVTVAPLPMTALGRVVYLSIAQETVANEADESAQLRIYLSDVDGVELSDDAALHDIVVHYTLGGTASPGIDHQGQQQGTVYIPPGQRSVLLSIPLIDDVVAEHDETITVNLQSSSGYLLSARTIGTIRVVDNEPVISIEAPSVAPVEGGNQVTFTIRSSREVGLPLNVYYDVSGTATPGDDYTPLTGVAQIPGGQTTARIVIIALSDRIADADESIVISLKSDTVDPPRYRIAANAQSLVTIAEPAVPPEESVGTVRITTVADTAVDSVPVQAAGFQVSVSRQSLLNPTIAVPLAVGGTALPNIDYRGVVGVVVLPSLTVTEAAPAGAYFVRVRRLFADGEDRTPVTVPAGGTCRALGHIMLTLKEQATLGEEDQLLVLQHPVPEFLPVGTIIGVNDVIYALQPVADTIVEGTESIVLTLREGAANYTLDASQRSITLHIVDTIPYAEVSIKVLANPAVDSGTPRAASFVVVAERSGARNPDLVIPMVVGGDALPGIDYRALPTQVIIPEAVTVSAVAAGATHLPLRLAQANTEIAIPLGAKLRVGAGDTAFTVITARPTVLSSQPTLVSLTSPLTQMVAEGVSVGVCSVQVNIEPLLDENVEGSEQVIVNLLAPSLANFTLVPPSSVALTIVDTMLQQSLATLSLLPNPAKTVAVDTDPVKTGEFRIIATRQGDLNTDISVALELSGTARSGVDFVALPTTVVLPELIVNSPAAIGDTQLALRLARIPNQQIILPAGAALRIGASDRVRVAETTAMGDTPFTVQLQQPLHVQLAVGSTVGVEEVALPVVPIADAVSEGLETVTLRLQNRGTYAIGATAQATILIADSDLQGIVTIGTPAAPACDTEPVQAASVTIHAHRFGTTNPDISVQVAVSGTALSGVDYTPLPTTVTLPQLVTTQASNAGSSAIMVRLANSGSPVRIPIGGMLRIEQHEIAVLDGVTVGNEPVNVLLKQPLPFAVPAGTAVGVCDIALTVTPLVDAIAEGVEVVVLSLLGSNTVEVGTPNGALIEIHDRLQPRPTTAEVVWIEPVQTTANEEGLIPARVRIQRSSNGFPTIVRYRISGSARSSLHRGSLAKLQTTAIGRGYVTNPVLGAFAGGLLQSPFALPIVHLEGGSGNISSIVVKDGGQGYYRVVSASQGNDNAQVEQREPSPPRVVIVGDGIGAAAVAHVSGSEKNYQVTRIEVVNPGRGYSWAQVFLIPRDGNGEGAVAEAVIAGTDASRLQVVDRGYGYLLPSVTATGGGGSGAVLRPVVTDGRLSRIVVEQPGAGYQTPPRIVIEGGSGTGAQAEAAIDAQGRIKAVRIIDPGQGYGPRAIFDDPNTTAEQLLQVRATIAGPDYQAPPATWIDPQSGDLLGVAIFNAAETSKIIDLLPMRNGISGATSAIIHIEPAPDASYSVGQSSSVQISFADADDTLQIAVNRPVAYPTPPSITSTTTPLEILGRGEWVVHASGEERNRQVAIEVAADPGIGQLVADQEAWLVWNHKPIDATGDDIALVVPRSYDQQDAGPPAPGSTTVAIDQQIFAPGDVFFFEDPLSRDPAFGQNGLYRVVQVSAGKQNENPSITFAPALKRITTQYLVTRVRKVGQFIADGNFARLRFSTYSESTDRYFYLFPVIREGERQPRGRRSMMLRLVQSDDYRIISPTTGTVILADDAVTARIRHVRNVVRPTMNGAVEVEFDRPFPIPIAVPFRIVEHGTTAQIGRVNTTDPADDVVIPALNPDRQQGQIEIPAGERVGQIIVQPNPLNTDAVFDQVTLQLMPSYDYLFGPLGSSPVNPTAVVSIAPVPRTTGGRVVYVAITADARASESAEWAELRVFLSDAAGNEISDDVLTEDIAVRISIAGTATANIDYTIQESATVRLAKETREARLRINLVNDTWVEDEETVVVTVQQGTGYLLSPKFIGTLRIIDDEPLISIQAANPRVEEGGAPVPFMIQSSRALPNDLAIKYQVAGTATNGTDFDFLSGVVTLPAGLQSTMLPIVALSDGINDPDETVIVTLLTDEATPARYRLGSPTSALMTITDPPAPLVATYTIVAQRAQVGTDGTVTMVEAPAHESGTAGVVTITATRVGASNPDLVIPLTVSGTAVPGQDYEPLPASVTLRSLRLTARALAGQTFVTVQPVGSGAVSIPAGGALRVGDTAQIVRVRRAVEVGEGGMSIELTAPLSSSLEAGTVLGVCTAEIVVAAIDDDIVEGVEQVVIVIPTDSTGAGSISAAVVVQDNDRGSETPTLVASYAIVAQRAVVAADGSVTMVEAPAREGGEGALTITATRVGASNPDLVIPLTVSGTAVPGQDYEPLPASVTLRSVRLTARALAGQTFVTVQPVGSGALSIPAGGALRVGETTQIVRVRRAVEVGEGGTSIELTAPLSSSLEAGTVLGVCTAELTIRAMADSAVEGEETVIVAIPQNSIGFTSGLTAATVRIVDASAGAASGDAGSKPPPTASAGGGGGGCGSGLALFLLLVLAALRVSWRSTTGHSQSLVSRCSRCFLKH